MFQAGGLVVVLVEVIRKAYQASIVPVIVNAILNKQQVIVYIMAFVSKSDFPRSRLGEKQRGKILASWRTWKRHVESEGAHLYIETIGWLSALRKLAELAIQSKADCASDQLSSSALRLENSATCKNSLLLFIRRCNCRKLIITIDSIEQSE